MSDIAEGMGGAMEGALAGRAVEPDHGELSGGAGSTECSNCGATVTGAYCSQCGQKLHVHRTLSAIFHDLIHGVLHLDGKFWATLPLLVFKPGKLTRRYIEGERAKFVSPMAMFLFSVFAMFAVFQMAGLSLSSLDFEDPRSSWDADVAREAIASETTEARETRSRIEEQIAAAEADNASQDELSELRSNLSAQDELIAELEASNQALNRIIVGTTQSQVDEPAVSSESDQDPVTAQEASPTDASLTGIKFLDEGIIKKWRDNPGLMLYKLQANGYKFSWLLIPLSVPFVWILFAWKRRFRAYDHAIFVTYSLSFMSLLFIAVSVASMVGLPTGLLATAAFLIPALHIYKQLRGTYNLSRFSAIWRFFMLFISINIVLVLFLQALLVLGAF